MIGCEESNLLFIFYHIPSRLLRSAATAEGAWMKLPRDLDGIMGRKTRRGVFTSDLLRLNYLGIITSFVIEDVFVRSEISILSLEKENS